MRWIRIMRRDPHSDCLPFGKHSHPLGKSSGGLPPQLLRPPASMFFENQIMNLTFPTYAPYR